MVSALVGLAAAGFDDAERAGPLCETNLLPLRGSERRFCTVHGIQQKACR